jgi:hypothetical protein
MYKPEQYLITAGGKIKCKRCQARSSRKKQQCGKPAIHLKNVCNTHGGLSTGPKTAEGIKRIQNARWKHGNETNESRAERSAKSVMFRYLIDLGNHCNLFYKQLKPLGRPPSSYKKADLTSPEQLSGVIRWLLSNK